MSVGLSGGADRENASRAAVRVRFFVMSKILIVEDDIFLGDTLIQKLKAEEYDVRLARDGVSGFKLIREWRPDLILLDLVLPQMDGHEVLKAIGADASLAETPVIVISDQAESTAASRTRIPAVKDYLVKTQFDAEEAAVKVRAHLRKAERAPRAAKNHKEARGTASAGAVPAETAGGRELLGKKIMWVEDDRFLSDIIARKLSLEGCSLINATDGAEALRLLEKEHPDLVLLDILLPGVDGYQVLKRIKTEKRTENIPVILLSNLGGRDDIEKGMALGAARFLVKATVTLDEIVDEIKAVSRGVTAG